MSLINDALKRAKQAQQEARPPSEPPPHVPPIEPAQHARHNLGLLIPVMLSVIGMLILFVIWQAAQRSGTAQANKTKGQTEVTASTRTSPTPASPPAPTFTKIAQASPHSATMDASNVVAASNALAATNSAVPGSEAAAITNSTNALTEAPAPKPAPLRLQAIVFNPIRPSAMIGGKTLFIGDKLGELRVAAIDRDSATLVGPGQTNVLALPEQ